MKKTYKIEVDCASCANKIENAINRIGGVDKATVNFMTQKMTIEFADGGDKDAIMQEVVSTCRKIEPDFAII